MELFSTLLLPGERTKHASAKRTRKGWCRSSFPFLKTAFLTTLIVVILVTNQQLTRFIRTNDDEFNGSIVSAIEASSCRNEKGTWLNVTIQPALKNKWADIDKIVSKYPKAKVSGGIFLYPRQTTLLTSMVSLLADYMQKTENRSLTVCETGFGAGHSAAMFLKASTSVNLHLFDMFDRPYQLPVVEKLKKSFPGHNISHYPGNSCVTVPKFMVPISRSPRVFPNDLHCDVLHGSSLCKTDNIDLVEKSPCGVLLTTTAMDSLEDNVVYFGPKGQWTRLREKGCIRDITCFEEEDRRLDRNFIFNSNGATIRHKFCFAITTGKCQTFGNQTGLQEMACERGLASFTRQELRLSSLCKSWQVDIPGG